MASETTPEVRLLAAALKQRFSKKTPMPAVPEQPPEAAVPPRVSTKQSGEPMPHGSTSQDSLPLRARGMTQPFHPSLQSTGQRILENEWMESGKAAKSDAAGRTRKSRKRKERRQLGPEDTARMQDACDIFGMSENTIRNRYNKTSKYYDPAFPVPKRLGNGQTRSAIGWRAGDLFAYRDRR